MLWLGLAYHKEYSMMKMSLEHHKETLQYLIRVDLLQGLKHSLPITSSVLKYSSWLHSALQ